MADKAMDDIPTMSNVSDELSFDGDNSYPDCEQCGHCCEYINLIAISDEDLSIMKAYVEEHHIQPRDRGKLCCCFQRDDGGCMIWAARPQICRLYNCHVPRIQVLAANPDIVVPDDLPLVDLHDTFVATSLQSS